MTEDVSGVGRIDLDVLSRGVLSRLASSRGPYVAALCTDLFMKEFNQLTVTVIHHRKI